MSDSSSSSSLVSGPCPICFEIPSSKVGYTSASNHSWSNRASRCDGHGVCWSCLQQHVEIQVLSEGKSNIRCPGEGCRYYLLQQDVERAMLGASAEEKVLSAWKQLRDQSCQDRLWDAITADMKDSGERWVLEHSQPCPTCFTLARREQGCNHVVCRCGTAFCFGCGAPSNDGCICSYLNENSRNGEVYFAAWLRSAEGSPEICNWLWEEVWSASQDGDNMDMTFDAWLWAAGLAGNLQLVLGSVPSPAGPRHPALTPLQWETTVSDNEDWCSGDDDCPSGVEDDQEVCGHLRKEIFSLESQRMQQRKVRRRRGDTTHWSQNPLGDLAKVQSVPAQPPQPRMKTRSRRIERSNA